MRVDEVRALMSVGGAWAAADLAVRPAWHRDAACKEHPDASWFPGRGEDVRPVKDVCKSCLVMVECLDYALGAGDSLVGIWGGTSERERRHIRRARAAA